MIKKLKFNCCDFLLCLLFILICDLAGYISIMFQVNSLKTWYPTLNKSILNPPSYVFGIVWPILYALLGISTFIVVKKAKKNEIFAIAFLFFTNLMFNILWSVFFFGLQKPLLAFIEVIALFILTLFLTKAYNKISKFAGYMLFPYILWLGFAIYLNFIVVLLN